MNCRCALYPMAHERSRICLEPRFPDLWIAKITGKTDAGYLWNAARYDPIRGEWITTSMSPTHSRPAAESLAARLNANAQRGEAA